MGTTDGAPPALQVQPSGNWLGNDGSWSGFLISVGTPPQNFTILPATSSPFVYVPVADDCQRINHTDCGSLRGTVTFGNRPSPGFQSNASSTWDLIGLYELDENRDLGLKGNGIAGYESIGIGSNSSSDGLFLNKQTVVAYASPERWIGQLGLGTKRVTFRQNERSNSTLLDLKNNGFIPSLSFGYTAGASYRSTKVAASLTLGGYDRSRVSDVLTIPMNDGEETPLLVGLQSIVVTNSLNGTFNLLHEAILAPIDSSMSELWLPTSVCDHFATAFGLEYQNSSDRYALTETTRDKLRGLSPRLTFTIGDGLVEGNTMNLDFPYAAFDLKATYPIFPDATAYFPIRRAANESQYMIGRAFLQEVYLGVDFERKKFNISQARFETPMPDPDIITIMPLGFDSNSTLIPQKHPGSHHLSPGAIAGIVIGAIIATLLAIGIVWFFCFRQSPDKKIDETAVPSQVEPPHKDPEGHEIMGDAIGELSAYHGQSEVQHENTVSYELEAKYMVERDNAVMSELEAQSAVELGNRGFDELEGKRSVNEHEVR